MTLPKRDHNGRFITSKVLVLKVVNPDMSSQHSPTFKYPKSGMVKAPDWKRNKQCGNGLHGWMWGQGSTAAKWTSVEPGSKWLVIEVSKSDMVNLHDEKIKFSKGNVVFCGSRTQAYDYIVLNSSHVPSVVHKIVNPTDKLVAVTDVNTTIKSGYGAVVASNSVGTEVISNYNSVSVCRQKESSIDVEAGSVGIMYDCAGIMNGKHESVLIWMNNGTPKTFLVGSKGVKANTWYKFNWNTNMLVEVKI